MTPPPAAAPAAPSRRSAVARPTVVATVVAVGATAAAVAAAAAWLAPAAADPAARGPSGRANIVRVERPRAHAGAGPRVCPILLSGDTGTCYGGRPAVGATAAVFDHEGYRGRVRVLTVTAVTLACHLQSAAEFTFEWLDRGPARAAGRGGSVFMLAVFGIPVTTQGALLSDLTRVRSPGGDPGERPWMALDTDGDRAPDLITTAHDCTHAAPGPPAGADPAEIHCIDYWMRDGAGFSRARRDYYYSCR